MGFLFHPDHMLAGIESLDARALSRRGVTLLFCDVDNTLTRWNDKAVPSRALALAARLRANNIDLCLVSNNKAPRVKPVAEALRADFIAKAGKPLPFALSAYRRSRRAAKRKCALIGDQLLTDVLAGNWAGMETHLVKPLDPSREFRGTRVNRFFERLLFRLMGLKWEAQP